ncbi:DUF2325 domain-containing protein [Hippea maritima]|uniref:DUF2325 domain-containing protein n=1 Tax=Hippea maritima (strain ATCC 700847 / DSM 10411 / MH2) TaxID=760142 RepID=F2LVP1_HIPMA|nr:DUF2325 domain-containing protein [Hippea maritima]AEA33825.1 hypothetical protein Hipma_0855 [Hippea maritima DSM 10411]
MGVLVVGGDKIDPLRTFLKETLKAKTVIHYPAEKLNRLKAHLPNGIDLVVVLINCINQNTMKTIKSAARRRRIPFLYTHSLGHLKRCIGDVQYIFCH